MTSAPGAATPILSPRTDIGENAELRSTAETARTSSYAAGYATNASLGRLPALATIETPRSRANLTACSSFGSGPPPSAIQMTFAPLSTAHLIAEATAVSAGLVAFGL